jgi:hypothetical protein
MPNPLVKRALCLGATALAIGAAAAPAQAASKFYTGTTNCPQGKVALGGGAQVVGEGTKEFKTALMENSPGTVGGGATSLWFSTVRNMDTAPHTIGQFAVCANAPKGYQLVRRDVAVGAGAVVRDTVTCPTGKVALAGGGSIVGQGSADFKTRMQESAPGTVNGGAQSVWLVSMRNTDIAPHTMGIFAVCAAPPAGYQVVRRDVTLAGRSFVRDTATCPKGKIVLGGGASIIGAGTGDFNTRIQELAPGTIGGGAQSLHLAAVRNYSSVSRTLGIHAVCASPMTGYQVIRQDHALG